MSLFSVDMAVRGFQARMGDCPERLPGAVLNGFGGVEGWNGRRCAEAPLPLRPVSDRDEPDFSGKGPVERLPVGEGDSADQIPRVIPQIETSLPMLQRPSERPAAVPLNLVNGEGRHGEQSEHVAQMVVAMAAGVLKRIHVPGLQGLERLVFNGP
ncbi:MAG: hypothetical protein OXC66_15340, partial [Roseovarius sp.]|nr:hypothetical protein [Roseovarius sp.]